MPRFFAAVLAGALTVGLFGQAASTSPNPSTPGYSPPVPIGVRGDQTEPYRGPVPIPSPNRRWLRVSSPRFNVISTASEATARDVAEKLETLASALAEVHPRFRPKTIETRVILFARRSESQPYFDFLLNRSRARAPGMFVTSRDGSATMVIDAGSVWTDRTVVHELVHNLLSASGALLPIWLEEGIAEYFSTAEVFRGAVRIGRPIREHERLLRSTSVVALPQLFAARTESDVRNLPMLYAESWAVVDWMMRTDDEAFYRFVGDVEGGADASASLEKHFRTTAATLQRIITNASMRGTRDLSVDLPQSTTQFSAGPISYADALTDLASFLASTDMGRPDAERHLDAALVASPGHPRALSTRAMLRARDKKYDEAYALFEQALASPAADVAVRLDYAEALLQNSFGPFAGVMDLPADAAPRFRKARELASSTTGWRADAIVGSSYVVETEVSAGIAPLERAHEARPARMDVALNFYALLLRTGQHDRAEKFFNDIFLKSKQPQTTLAARAVFVRERLTEANRKLAEGDLDAGAAIVRTLVAVTPDPAAKLDLERQLTKLEADARANREIVAYNNAVDAANRRDNKTALDIIDALLATARDEKVIEDATKLRDIVQRRMQGMRRSSGTL